MTSIAILIPVLNRPQRVQPLVESLAACSKVIECRPVFIVSSDDEAELDAVAAAVGGAAANGNLSVQMIEAHWPGGSQGDYALKMNWAFEHTDDPFVFLGADDLVFHPGWAERAVACWYETGACVVGTNDLGNSRVTSGEHSTHTLVHRDYGECGTVDGDTLLHVGYHHNWVDDEFVATAKWRETFAHATDARVEHLHPNWGKATLDATYRHGLSSFNDDRDLYRQREHLWQGRTAA